MSIIAGFLLPPVGFGEDYTKKKPGRKSERKYMANLLFMSTPAENLV
jgi:hypothetical protein